MMDELLPCPFCGGDADLDYYHNENGNGGAGRVVCVECGASTSGDNVRWMAKKKDKAVSKAQAVEAWNRRTPAPDAKIESAQVSGGVDA